MKLQLESISPESESIAQNAVSLPNGILGFADYKRAELLYMPDHLPFLWMKLSGAQGHVNFVVIEPGGIIPDYELEIFDKDAEELGITNSVDAMVLNIVTLRQQSPLEATVNLIGPILINRRTRIGRQLVIANHSRYSARHLLVHHEAQNAASA